MIRRIFVCCFLLLAIGSVTNPLPQAVGQANKGDRFKLPEGFRSEKVIKDPLSLVNMCFDNRGRLLVSQEGGPILLCSQPNKETGMLESVKPYCDLVKNCHGMCWIDDSLYLVGNGPQGTGLYRCKENKEGDKIDQAVAIHKFQGGIGEHGPHAVLHGPDNWLYVVIGNHAHAQVDKLAENSPLRRWPTGAMGPDQGKPGTTEDVLLPRQNDANGHAANILAPGGTVWRMDKDGKNVSLFSAGYRNHFDAAFNSMGELVTFDSDMEWDEALPWYRPVRVLHATPGSDFVWRTGSANTPDYYIDSLPSAFDTGRGSPVGVECYEHNQFPAKYRGAYFLGDWSLGIIWAFLPEKVGATYKGKVEKFCTGSPLNVTDVAVGPDGALYFTMGGRGSQGGIYRIVYGSPDAKPNLPYAQPLAPYSREAITKSIEELKQKHGKDTAAHMGTEIKNHLAKEPQLWQQAVMALNAMQGNGVAPDAKLLLELAADKNADIRAHAIYLLGVNGYPEGKDALIKALKDEDKWVQRRACEALIRAGIEPPVESIWPLLGDSDRFLRTAARLVLERIEPAKWADKILKDEKDVVAWEGIIALCKINRASSFADSIYKRLNKPCAADPEAQVNHVRTIQLALIHAPSKSDDVKAIAAKCLELFPTKDWRVNRELAILLSYFGKEKLADPAVVISKVLADLQACKDDKMQQIHYFYCLRVLNEGWKPAEKEALVAWFDTAKTWNGGHSFRGFLDNILRDANPIFTAEDRTNVLAKADQFPRAAAALLKLAPAKEVPPANVLIELYGKLAAAKPPTNNAELKTFIIDGLSQSGTPEAQAALRKIVDGDPSQRETVARALARTPTADNFAYIARGLQSTNKLVLNDIFDALKKVPAKPKVEDAAPFRAALVASEKLDEKQRWKAVEVMRLWTGRNFGAENPSQWKQELTSFGKWFSQTYPKEAPLPNLAADKPPESKYKFAELLPFLEKDPAGKGDAAKGRLVFEKGACIKCHKYGTIGEGIGPDLSNLSKRFKRNDVLSKLCYPSKTISDQYRGTVILTTKGVQVSGLAAAQGDVVTVLQSDGTKLTLKKSEIEQQIASLVSVMPEKLLDQLSKEEIADLFAFLETEPK